MTRPTQRPQQQPTAGEWEWVPEAPERALPPKDDGTVDHLSSKVRHVELGPAPYLEGEAKSIADGEELATTSAKPTTYIQASLLIPGKGSPSSNQAIIAEEGKVTYVGDIDSVPAKYADLNVSKKVPVLMPGMWDCHAHFFGCDPAKPIDMVNLSMTNAAAASARSVRQLHDVLYAGFTSCVELGGYGPELQNVIDEGSILGPTLYPGGAFLSMTAGHGDCFELPLGAIRQKFSVTAAATDVGIGPVLLADGIDECRKAVRMNLRRGAKVIKVLTSGGATSLKDNPLLQQYSDEELKVIVDEARRMNLVCAAHAIGKPGIVAAIRAGFKVIEHNTYADEEVLQEMKEKGVMMVATMAAIQTILDHKESFPKSMYDKVAQFGEAHAAMYRNAVRLGVQCAIGNDMFGGPGTILAPGRNGYEVVLATKYGMTPLQAIETATANGPLTLGPQAPKSGQIKVGYDADFISLEKNPLDDISVLREPRNIKYIWKSGKLVKAPGIDSWDLLGI